MGPLLNIILVVQMVVAIAMIAMILIQQGKGAEMGAAFGSGSGSSGSLFGASGGANFMSRTTSILAAIFFACTLILAYFGNLKPAGSGSVLESAAPASAVPGATNSAPATPAVPATGAAQIPTK